MNYGLNQNQYNVANFQNVPSPEIKREILAFPATGVPSFGNITSTYCTLTSPAVVEDAIIELGLNAVTFTGLTGFANVSSLVPANLAILTTEIIIGGTSFQLIRAQENHIKQQLFCSDEKRMLLNNAVGNYASATQRYTMNASANKYYVNLWSIFQESKPFIPAGTIIEIKTTFDTTANIFNPGTASGTWTGTASISSVVCYLKTVRYKDPAQSNLLANSLRLKPIVSLYNDTKFQPFVSQIVSAGVAFSNQLTQITGKVNFIYFTIQNTSSMTGMNMINYQPITSFTINGNDGSPIHGVAIPSNLALLTIGSDNTGSTYLSETATGLTNNNAYVYMYSFSLCRQIGQRFTLRDTLISFTQRWHTSCPQSVKKHVRPSHTQHFAKSCDTSAPSANSLSYLFL